MTQRSAPIIGRRLSLPYAKLPTLIPKPGVLKRANPSTVSNQQLAKIQYLGPTNKVLLKPNQRPVPGLNKVINIPVQNSVNASAKAQPNASVLRKSAPPPMTRAQTVNAASPKLISIKPGQITRLPPALKPKPKAQIVAQKTYSTASTNTYLDLHDPGNIQEVKDTDETNNESAVDQTSEIQHNSSLDNEKRDNNIM